MELRTGVSSKHDKGRWGFIAKKQLVDGKLLRASGNCCYADLIGFLLKAGQADQVLPQGWWGKRNLGRYDR